MADVVVTDMVCGRYGCGRYGLWPIWYRPIRETSGKLLTKAYGIVHNVGLLRVSLTFSVINDNQK